MASFSATLRAWSQVADCKSQFKCLKFEIGVLLKEAEDMFLSMSVPLLRLTGLKEVDMKEQGRRCSIRYVAEDGMKCSFSETSTFLGSENGRRQEGSDGEQDKCVQDGQVEALKKKVSDFFAHVESTRKHQLRELVEGLDKLEVSVYSAERYLLAKIDKQEGQVGALIDKFCRKVRDVDRNLQENSSKRSPAMDELQISRESYQNLLSLTGRLLPSIIDVLRENRSSLKADVNEMVESLRQCMRMPLLFILQRLKAQALVIRIPELQVLVDQLQVEALGLISVLGASNEQMLAKIGRLESYSAEKEEELEVVRLQLARAQESLKDLQQKNKHVEELERLKIFHERRVDELSSCLQVLEAVVEDQATELVQKKNAIMSVESQIYVQRHLQFEASRECKSLAERASALEGRIAETKRYESMVHDKDAEIARLLRLLKKQENEMAGQEEEMKREAAMAKQQIAHLQKQLRTGTVAKHSLQNELRQMRQKDVDRKRGLRSRACQTPPHNNCEAEAEDIVLGGAKVSKTFSCLFMPNRKMRFSKLLEEQSRNPT